MNSLGKKAIMAGASAMLMFVATGQAQTEKPGDLAAGKAVYDQQVRKIEADHVKNLSVCAGEYRKALDALGAKFQNAGDLDGLVAVKKEKEDAELDPEMPDQALAEKPPELKELQLKYRKNRDDAEQLRAKRIITLAGQYNAELDRTVKALTRAGKVDQALEVRAEIESLATNNLVASAKAKLGADVTTGAQKPRPLPENLRKGLVLYYSFDKNEGDKVTDESGENNHGKVVGARWTSQGKISGAYNFAETNQCIQAPSAKSVNFSGKDSYTYSVWLTSRMTMKRAQSILNKQRNITAESVQGVGLTAERIVTAYNCKQNIAAQGVRSKNALSVGVWHHIVTTYDRERLVLYIDGNSHGSVNTSHQDAAQCQGFGWIGCDYLQGQNFNGLIDEFMIFNRALSEQEVKQLYELQK